MFRKKNTIQKSEQNTALESGRTQTVVLSLLFALCFGVGLSFHVFEWSTQTPAPPFLSLLYQAVLMIGYGSLALVLNQIFRTRRASPARSMWSVLVAGVVTLTIGAVTSRIGSVFVGGGSPEIPGFDLETGVPLALASIFKMNILSRFHCIRIRYSAETAGSRSGETIKSEPEKLVSHALGHGRSFSAGDG